MSYFGNGNGWGNGWGSGVGGATGAIMQLDNFTDLAAVAIPPDMALQGQADPRGYSEFDVHPDLWASLHAGTLARQTGLMQGGSEDLTGDLLILLAEGNAKLKVPTGSGAAQDISNELTERTDRTNLRTRGGEIVDQSGAFLHYYYQMLGIDPRTHLNTIRLMSIAYNVASVVGMSYKLHFMRPRPSQVFPGFMPVLPNPPHPSFPSNHATQAHTVTGLLREIIEAPRPGDSSPRTDNPLSGHLVALAKRIAENREIAGVHFRSDTSAGELIATGLVGKLYADPLVDGMIDEARNELKRYLL